MKINQSLISIFFPITPYELSFKMAAADGEVEVEVEQSTEAEDSAWSVSNTRLLIEFYKTHRLLWDKNQKDYGNKTKINKVLTSLVAKFEKASPPRTMNEIKKCWHGLRSCALRYFKRKSEHDNVKWAYWSDLSFLRESVAAEETGSEIAWSNQDTGKSELYKFYFYYTEWTSACIFRHN